MKGLILANVLVTRAPQTLDQVLLVGGIFIIEPLVLWFLTNKVRFPKLILVSLTANIASSVIGSILGGMTVFGTSMGPYEPFFMLIPAINRENLLTNSYFILIGFFLSALIEWPVYKRFKIPHALKASFLTNSASYLLIIIYIVSLAVWFPEYAFTHIDQEAINGLSFINKLQQYYHLEKGKFTSDFEALGLNVYTTNYEKYYDFSIEVRDNVAYSFANVKNPQEHQKYVITYSALISYEKSYYKSIICQSKDKGVEPDKPNFENIKNPCGKNMNTLPKGGSGLDRINLYRINM